jgi:hypothetical protein
MQLPGAPSGTHPWTIPQPLLLPSYHPADFGLSDYLETRIR